MNDVFDGLHAGGCDRVGDYSDTEFVILCGPSGAGKTTAFRMLLGAMDFYAPVSVTTRAPRTGESHGIDYKYITEAELAQLVADGEVLTGDGYVGNHYADTWPPKNKKRILLEVTLGAALLVKKLFPKKTTIFFFRPPGETVDEWRAFLTERLNGRGTEQPEVIKARVDRGIEEIMASIGAKGIIPIFNYVTANSVVTVTSMLEDRFQSSE